MSSSRLIFAATCVAMLVAASASGAPITIFNTGVNNSNALLGQSAIDPHYRIIASGDPANPGPNAFTAGIGGIPPTWIPNGPNSNWISPNNNPQGAYPPVAFTYRTTFDLTGFNAATAQLSGQLSADDSAQVILNGTNLGTFSAFGGWTAFHIFSLPGGSPFVGGLNTLDFLVSNAGFGPSGVRVEVSGTVGGPSAVPEPASWMLTGMAAIGLAFARRWVRSRR